MTKKEFLAAFLEEVKLNGMGDAAKVYLDMNLATIDAQVLQNIDSFTVQSYEIQDITYKKITVTNDIRTEEIITCDNKFRVFADGNKMVLFVIGDLAVDFKIIPKFK